MTIYEKIEKSFSTMEKLFICEEMTGFVIARIFDLSEYHFGLGTWIRNELLYVDETSLHRLFLENGMEHSDDMSSFIIRLFHYHMSKKGRRDI